MRRVWEVPDNPPPRAELIESRRAFLFMHDIGRFTHGDENERLFPVAMDGGYRALDELRSSGQISAIGLGVNEWEVCEAAMEHGDWDLFLLAGRYTLLEQAALDTFLPKCVDRNCSVVIGGPYNSGILATGVKGEGHYDYGDVPEWVVKSVERIEALCGEYGIPMQAAALQFPLAHPAVVSVIPGMARIHHVTATCEFMETPIPAELWQALRAEELIRAEAPVPAGDAYELKA